MRVYAYEAQLDNIRTYNEVPNSDFFDSYEETNWELLLRIKHILLDWFFHAKKLGADPARLECEKLLLEVVDTDEDDYPHLLQSRKFSFYDLLQDDSQLDVQVPDGGYIQITTPARDDSIFSIRGYLRSKNLGEKSAE